MTKKKIYLIFIALTMSYYCMSQDSTSGCKEYLQTEKVNDSTCGTGRLESGKKEGLWIFYRKDIIVKVANFKNGLMDGKAYYYNASGILIREADLKNGKFNGLVKFYAHDGRLLAIYEYTNSFKGKTIYYVIDNEMPPKNHSYRPEY